MFIIPAKKQYEQNFFNIIVCTIIRNTEYKVAIVEVTLMIFIMGEYPELIIITPIIRVM